LTPGPGFTGTVSLRCSGAPLGAVCQLPSSVSLANGAATPFTVTVNTSGLPCSRRPFLSASRPFRSALASAPGARTASPGIADCFPSFRNRHWQEPPPGVGSSPRCPSLRAFRCHGLRRRQRGCCPSAGRHSLRHFDSHHHAWRHVFIRPTAAIAVHSAHADRSIASPVTRARRTAVAQSLQAIFNSPFSIFHS
jgi:hypothetical protein